MRAIRHLAVLCLLLLSPAVGADRLNEPFGALRCADALDAAKSRAADRSAGQAAFGRLIESRFDLPAISVNLLGRHWQTASPADREAFRQAFLDYLVLTYAGRVSSTPDARIRVVGSRQADRGWSVRSAVEGVGDRPYAVDWLVHQAGGRWQVIDVSIGGISMAATYRDQFVAVLRANGGNIANLTSKLEQKNRTLAD